MIYPVYELVLHSANEDNVAEDDGNDYYWYDDGDDLMYIGLREPWLLCGTVTSPRWTRRRHNYPTVRRIQAFDEGNLVDNKNDCDFSEVFRYLLIYKYPWKFHPSLSLN